MKRHRVAEIKLRGKRLEIGAMIAGTRDIELQVLTGTAGVCQGPQSEPYSFITLEPSNVQESRCRRPAPGRVGRGVRAIYTGMNHPHLLRRHTPGPEINT